MNHSLDRESHKNTLPYAIKFFDPTNPMNACIVDIGSMDSDKINELREVQEFVGRTEMEFLTKEGR